MSRIDVSSSDLEKLKFLWVEDMKSWNKSKNTIRAYIRSVDDLLSFVKPHDLNEISRLDIIQFFANIENVTRRTKNQKLAGIKCYFDFLRLCKIIKDDPSKDIRSMRIPKNVIRILSPKEYYICKEISKKDQHKHTIFMLILWTGLREDEIANLRSENIHLDEKIPYIQVLGKGEKERQIPLSWETKALLKDYRRKFGIGHYLFHSQRGDKYTNRGIYHVVRSVYEMAKIDFSHLGVHTLRHTFATVYYMQTHDLVALAEMLGHSDINTTKKYIHSNLEYLHKLLNKKVSFDDYR